MTRFTLAFEVHAIEVLENARSTTRACELLKVNWSTADRIMGRAVALYELSPQAQIDRLRNDEPGLALPGHLAEEDRSRFAVRSLMRNAMAAVLPEDHRLARRRQLDLKELAGDPFVSLSDAVFPGRRRFLRGIRRM
jgi:hypothetical protein